MDHRKSITKNVTVRLSHETTLYCRGKVGSSTLYPKRYSWTVNGKHVGFTMLDPSENLYIRAAQYGDAGSYLCTLRNTVGSATITFNLKVEGKENLALVSFGVHVCACVCISACG